MTTQNKSWGRRSFIGLLAVTAGACSPRETEQVKVKIDKPIKSKRKRKKKKSDKATDKARARSPEAPVRAITYGPAIHWGGYRDKEHVDQSGRYVIAMRSAFDDRLPTPEDTIEVGYVDLEKNNGFTAVGTSGAWNWQQGCMLQWRPAHPTELMWNDRTKGGVVTRVHDITTKKTRTIPASIYVVGPDGKSAWTIDYGRLYAVREGFGYPGLAPTELVATSTTDGLFRVDLESGKRELIVPFSRLAELSMPKGNWSNHGHFIEHIGVSPSGTRISFLHRWHPLPGEAGQPHTRLFTANPDGTELFLLSKHTTSHYAWKDDKALLAWTRVGKVAGFHLLRDKSEEATVFGKGVMKANGHCTFLAEGKYVLSDEVVGGGHRQLYVYDVAKNARVELGRFRSDSAKVAADLRCDLRPRPSKDGTKVLIDSRHGDNGRQIYLVDISQIVQA